jgi:uncharacterized protein DUF5335
MSNVAIPSDDWKEFLDSFSERHRGRLVRIEIHDLQTEENVDSEFMRLNSIELDTEDPGNSRINVTVELDRKEIKHVLFRPSRVTVQMSESSAEESLNVHSLNTSTTLRFRATVSGDATSVA